MQRFIKVRKARYRKANAETNDCTVVAVAIAGRMPYKAAHQACKAMGRPDKAGFYGTINTLRNAGFSVTKVAKQRQKNGAKFTPKTVGAIHRSGYFICFINHHVFSVVNGTVEDWSNNRQHHINEIYKVVRTRA